MEQNDRWMKERLGSLDGGEWKPDTARGLALLRERQRMAGLRARRVKRATLAAVAVGAVAMAFPSTRAFAEQCVDACIEQGTAAQQWLGQFHYHVIRVLMSLHGHGPQVNLIADRKPAPDFTLAQATGEPVRLSDLRGRVVLLNFWATWCAPCKAEMPWFTEFQNRYPDLAVLGVSFDDDGWKSVTPYLAANGIDYRVVIGDDATAQKFGDVSSLPTTVLIDKQGRIAAQHEGLVAKPTYEAELKRLLAEQ